MMPFSVTGGVHLNAKLIDACFSGNIQNVRICIAQGADIYHSERLAFRVAARQEKHEVLKLLQNIERIEKLEAL